MTRALALALLFAAPAHAAGNAPMTALVPEEWRVSVFEVTCRDLGDCCGVHRPCGDWYARPDYPAPAPVPLPWGGLMLAAACGLLWRMRHG